MKLPTPSIRKLFREHFPGERPLKIPMTNLSATARTWQEKVIALEGTLLSNHPGDRDSRSRTLCRFTIPDPHTASLYLRRDELRLEYNNDHELIVKAHANTKSQIVASVSDLSEIEGFVRSVLAQYARRHALAKKREKVRGFKSKAIVAQVKALAKEEQFDFATESDTQKLKLFVKLSESHLIEIHVPFSQFEKNLPRLRATISSMRELYSNGLRFKVASIKTFPWKLEWTKHHA
ncbi:hypothetical protein Pla22_51120 [Rubripirellula amarantea]|uniref:Uncharacterized protein n=2 Tax=Rubripirellula amarantea TaxID=2527999 RepID=A0A5C5WDE3_9BACT|nr:hypothetical protein Pla22_51120 [Rubripirellula amarantea]